MTENRFAYAILTEFEKHLPYQLIGAGYRWRQEDIVRPFGYPTFQWLQVSRGKGIADLGHGPVPIGPGNAMLIYPDENHSYRGIEDDFATCWMCFGGSHIEYLLQTLGMPSSGIYEVTDGHLLESRIEEAVTLLESGHSLSGLEASSLVYTTLLDIYKYLNKGNESYRAAHDRLSPVFEYIDTHYSGPIGVDELADIIGVSTQHFCLVFKKATRTRPIEYINHVRVNKARTLIRENHERLLADIAAAVGFENESYFSYVFKKIEGVSPRVFRSLGGIG